MGALFLKYLSEEDALLDEQQICHNCGFNCNNKAACNWAKIKKAHDQDFYFFKKPSGSHGFTEEQMMKGVNRYYEIAEFDEAWLPPEGDFLEEKSEEKKGFSTKFTAIFIIIFAFLASFFNSLFRGGI